VTDENRGVTFTSSCSAFCPVDEPTTAETPSQTAIRTGGRRLTLLARAAGLIPSPEFNLGEKNDFRVPDRGLHRPEITGDWRPTAAVAVEILSPGDETWAKVPFCAAHDIDELLIVDPQGRTVKWFALETCLLPVKAAG
jgi:Uma2 family endonuclease